MKTKHLELFMTYIIPFIFLLFSVMFLLIIRCFPFLNDEKFLKGETKLEEIQDA